MRHGSLAGPLIEAPCALGRAGYIGNLEKREGDGKTPLGLYPLRRVFYRPDRVQMPVCVLPVTPLTPMMGWCDQPDHPQYNQLVSLPFGDSHEKMWRDDSLYDVVLVIGHNDDPVVSGLGSAIFVHVAKSDYAPTEGCVALEKATLLRLLQQVRSGDAIQISRA
ncbi:L,D-transpeptidase family protein [Kordiimonas aquimaris]|uniref:L,D-transpeptidase family protein n=1 Tax=Kordiimonas aquimaris TaxID=707591 RepID=UPI0021CE675C|nr:L,D-transpeptidase family protein [Kordiimonas aquimaris]